jgi:hypothetical protein
MVFRKTADNGRYAENSMTVTARSWFENVDSIFDCAKESAEEKLKDQPGSVVFCTVFNRL